MRRVMAAVVILGGVSVLAAASVRQASSEGTPSAPGVSKIVAFDLGTCPDPSPDRPSKGTVVGDAEVRNAAQRGLTFLEGRAAVWNAAHDCYGCHVHAVTVEALAVGKDNDYRVDPELMSKLIASMTTGPGGSRSANGFDYAHGNSLVAPSKGFGGASFARYDALVDAKVRDDLQSVAGKLIQYQSPDGGLTDPESWTNRPVGIGGRIQLTAQAVSTWRQAYERSADEAWLASMAKAEDWLSGQLGALDPASADLQELNYALVGLLEAGGTVSEGKVSALIAGIAARQGTDGGWSLSQGGASDAYATGQTLYTLRRLGLSDSDPRVAKGTAWLMSHQTEAGGWREGGSEKAEAMWAVLGLVSVDVMTLAVEGITDGQHVTGQIPVSAVAAANGAEGVRQVELLVDDVPVAGACGNNLEATLDATVLASGPHLVEARATDGAGHTVRRRLEVYAGTHYLVGLGTKWDDGGTRVGLRSIAPASVDGTVHLQILKLDGDTPTDVVFAESVPARQGAVQFWWGATEHQGSKFLARITWRDPLGAVIQTVEHRFVHADPAVQRAQYGDVAGRVQFADGADTQNALVELLNDDGDVVGTARTTTTGQYRFKNVDGKKYKVRVSKEGRAAQEAEVEAAPATEAEQDFELQ